MLISPVTTEDDQRMIETCLLFLKMLSFYLNIFIVRLFYVFFKK